jgi:hypothetical protein
VYLVAVARFAHPCGFKPYSQKRSVAVSFNSHRNDVDHVNATLVSTVESLASVANLTELYLVGSSVWPTRMGGWLCTVSLALPTEGDGFGCR